MDDHADSTGDWLYEQHRRVRCEEPGVVEYRPRFGNERLKIQRGSFLVPVNAIRSFENNLSMALGIRDKEVLALRENPGNPMDALLEADLSELRLLKIIIPREAIGRVTHDLDEMNINAATLFPGLDGFGRSLRLRLLDKE